jgi:hypothetical protein
MATFFKHRGVLAVLAIFAILLGMLNFASFVGESQRLGGSAGNGYELGGRYFVGNHGRYTEVSREEWERSRIHGRSIAITHPLMMAAMGFLAFALIIPAFMGQARPDTNSRVERVRASGPPIASTSCSGRIGMVNVSGPLLRVSAHPLGILVKLLFSPARAVLAHEITGLESGRVFFRHAVTIHHTAPDLQSPIILYVAAGDALERAIRELSTTGASLTDA